MRILTIGLGLSLLAGTAALAEEGDPVQGVGVSVESSPGGIVVAYDNEADAQAACKEAGGTWSRSGTKITCNNPLRPMQRKGRGVAIGRQGGAFLPPKPAATPMAAATAAPEKPAAKPN